MATFDRDTVLSLARSRSWPSISLYVPTHRAGGDKAQDRIRFKNLIRSARDRLVNSGLGEVEADAALGAARDILDDPTFWRDTGEGLALFISPELFEVVRLDVDIPERIVIGGRFHLRTLLAAMRENHRFFALAVDRNGCRLFRGDAGKIEQVTLEGAPESVADELRYDEAGPTLQHISVPMPGSSAGAVFHGHGGEKDTHKIALERYLRKVATSLDKVTARERGIPLLLLGVEYEVAMFRLISDYPNIAAPFVAGATDLLKPHEIHAKALSALRPVFDEAEARWLSELNELEGSPLATHDPSKIANAAAEGRVKSLFFEDGDGALDEASWEMVDIAAADTMLTGGEVHAFLGTEAPVRGVAAVLRY